MLLKMVVDFPVLLPHSDNLILPTHPESVLEVVPQLVAWLISGNVTRTKKSLKKAQSCSLHHGDRDQPSLTTNSLGSGLIGAIRGIRILISGPVGEVVNFLAHLFKEGYKYRSLNAYQSAISSVHEKADGYDIGQHPLVSRLLKGAFNQRPPKPRYEATWNVSQVFDGIASWGAFDSLSLQHFTWKLAMLLSLTRPSRSSDLANLDLRFRKHTPEGVVFQEASLAKQSKTGQTKDRVLLPCLSPELLALPSGDPDGI